jgi:uncharacterized protein (TIGR04255 family)
VQHYTRAPIAEAVIDLNVSFGELPSIDRIEQFAQQFRIDFPQIQRINALSMFVGQNGEDGLMSSNTTSDPLGIRMTNAKGDRVLQLRRQGFSYSHLHPYSEWATFTAEMKPLWSRYVAEFAPASVTRLAVRFINRITVPQGVDLDVYLNVTPRLLHGVCSDVEGYFLQLVLPQRDLGEEWRAIINTGLEAAPLPDVMSVLLDIDLFCAETFEVDENKIWNVLNQLRDRKNDIFEAAITDEVRRMIL